MTFNFKGAISVLLGVVCYAGAEAPKAATLAREEIPATIERAKSDPNILWELKDAPIDQTFQLLSDLWFHGRAMHEQRLNSRKISEENEREWLAQQKRIGRDPDTAERLFPVAGDVLFNHPNLEAYLTVQLQLVNNYMTEGFENPGRRQSVMVDNPHGKMVTCLGIARRIPGDGAFRVVGSFLSAPDYPDLPRGDIRPRAPAKSSQKAMAILAKERLGIDLGEDVEATRKWWAENKSRFDAKPKPKSKPETAEAVAPPTSNSPQSPPQTAAPIAAAAAEVQPSKRWVFATVGALLALLATGVWFYSRSARSQG